MGEGSKLHEALEFSQHSVEKNSPLVLQKRISEAPADQLKSTKSKSVPCTPEASNPGSKLTRCSSEPPPGNKLDREYGSFIPSLTLAKPFVNEIWNPLIHVSVSFSIPDEEEEDDSNNNKETF